jgi:hypothetical protein
MAYTEKDRVIVAQNSASVAASLMSGADYGNVPQADLLDIFEQIRTEIFYGTLKLAEGPTETEAVATVTNLFPDTVVETVAPATWTEGHPLLDGRTSTYVPQPPPLPSPPAPPVTPPPRPQGGADGPSCPKCGGQLWDNRRTKVNPKAPDFKCKDKSCDGLIWPAWG